jgi:hypothetical protein
MLKEKIRKTQIPDSFFMVHTRGGPSAFLTAYTHVAAVERVSNNAEDS